MNWLILFYQQLFKNNYGVEKLYIACESISAKLSVKRRNNK